MAIHVGIAPDSWGVWFANDERQTPWQRFLDEVGLAGYAVIELGPYGYLPTDPNVLATELANRSLRLAGGTLSGSLANADGWQEMRARAAGVCDILTTQNARYLVVLEASSYFDGGARELDQHGWTQVIDNLQRLAEYTASRDIAAVFHPHAGTTVESEAQIERLLESTDASLIQLCLDVGHHAYPGGDPVAFFRKHHRRIAYLHLKDVDPTIARAAREADWPLTQAVAAGAFVDLGQGCVDFVGLKRVAEEVGYDGWGIVEQDMYPAAFDKPLPIARRNREYLRGIGLA